jgi:hypothetical protein
VEHLPSLARLLILSPAFSTKRELWMKEGIFFRGSRLKNKQETISKKKKKNPARIAVDAGACLKSR